MSKLKTAPLSLEAFMKAKRKADCPVCQLPAEVLDQLATARDKHIRRPDQVAWLNTEVGVSITSGDLDKHYSGRHNVA
jgi:hypothetical protein